MPEAGSGRPDVLVVGGGVVGTSCAYWLARAGVRVTLLERRGLAGGTSSACQSNVGAGVGVGEDLDYFRACTAAYRELRDAGLDLGWKDTPRLLVALTEAEAAVLRADVAIARQAGVAAEVWAGDPPRLEPRLASTVSLVAVESEGAQVNPMQTTVQLAQHATRAGATVLTDRPVVRLRRDGTRVIGIDTDAGSIDAGAVLIACGAWARPLAATAGVRLPIWPRKGHILVTEPAAGWTEFNITGYAYETSLGHGFAAAGADEPPPGAPEVGTVLQPLPQGQMLLGNSRESAGWDHSISRDRLSTIARAGIAMLPSLARLRFLRTYVGLRPWSPDGRPLLGPVRDVPGLWVATGHGGGGITGGPLAGRLIADQYTGRAPRIDPAPYLPDRFDLGPARESGRAQ